MQSGHACLSFDCISVESIISAFCPKLSLVCDYVKNLMIVWDIAYHQIIMIHLY